METARLTKSQAGFQLDLEETPKREGISLLVRGGILRMPEEEVSRTLESFLVTKVL